MHFMRYSLTFSTTGVFSSQIVVEITKLIWKHSTIDIKESQNIEPEAIIVKLQ